MFKENDKMRPGPTPERVFAICRLLDKQSYNRSDLYKLIQLSEESTPEESILNSIEASKELGLIIEDNNQLFLNIDKSALTSAQSFRKKIAPLIFSRTSSTFFKLTEWFISNSDKVLELSKFDEYAAEASRSGLTSITENDVLGWRFWMRFLGHAYYYNRTLIPNMKIRLEDAMSGIQAGSQMTCTHFLAWLTQETKDSLQFAVESCGEKTDNHTLDAGTVLALKNVVELLRNTLSSAWKESSEKNCTPIIESLNSLKSLLDFPQNAEEIIKKLEVAKSSLPSSSGSLQSYINDINHGKQIIEGLNFDSDPEVKLFIDKVRRGKATVRDLTPHILEWIKDNSLSDKIRLKF